MKRLRHSRRKKCPKCGRDGKVKRHRTHVVYICLCGFVIQAPTKEALKEKLKECRSRLDAQNVSMRITSPVRQ